MKLGEILVGKGLLTTDQLDLALKSQLIFGGHLGTSLLEMGLIDETTLGNLLAKATGVPYAAPHMLANLPQTTIRAVPAKVAEEYQAVPIKLADKTVHLALVDPRNLWALDELTFAVGRSVIPWIAPEARIFQALETYYQVERRARYVKLDRQLAEGRKASPKTEAAAPTAPRVVPVAEADPEDPYDLEIEFEYGRAWQDAAGELAERKSAALARPSPLMPLTELAEQYCRADSRDELARAVLDFGAGRAERMLLMMVRENRAIVWDGRGLAVTNETSRQVGLDVTTEAVFRLLAGNDHYHGVPPVREEVVAFYRMLGAVAPTEFLLIPIHVNDLLVAVALVDGGPHGRIEGEVEEILKAFRLFGTAIGMVALRKKIRDAARPLVPAGGPAD